jgi:hypothetical protein
MLFRRHIRLALVRSLDYYPVCTISTRLSKPFDPLTDQIADLDIGDSDYEALFCRLLFA